MIVSSESACVDKELESVRADKELESRSLKSSGTLSMNSKMISSSETVGMTLMVVRSLIEEVELKLTNVPPKSISLYCTLMPPVSLYASWIHSVSSSTVSGTSGRSILSELSSLNKMRSRMGFAILTDLRLSVRVQEAALTPTKITKDRDTQKTWHQLPLQVSTGE